MIEVVELFEKLRTKHQAFYNEVKRLHDSFPNQKGHDIYHSVHTAIYGIQISDRSTYELVWLAAIAHSLDRVCGNDNFEANIRSCLALANGISKKKIEIVVDALLKHGELNHPSDSPVLVKLKDADRLANLFLTLVIRVGQHRPNIPACEMKYLRKSNPLCPASDLSSHSRPQSSFDDLRYCSQNWPGMIRTPKARRLVGPLVQEIIRFLDTAASQYEALGMDRIEI